MVEVSGGEMGERIGTGRARSSPECEILEFLDGPIIGNPIEWLVQKSRLDAYHTRQPWMAAEF